MSHKKDLIKYSKFLTYILGLKPDEFGLVPDEDGYVKTKEFLKAVTEEDGWKFFRKSHVDEIMISIDQPPVEVRGNSIRARSRTRLTPRRYLKNPPKILYTAIRRKAHPFVVQKGVRPMGRRHVILSSSKELAERIGKRIDSRPVLLTVMTEKAIESGSQFFQFGDDLFLSAYIAAECFIGPPLPKTTKEAPPKERVNQEKRDRAPGSFFPDLKEPLEKQRTQRQRRRKELEWKEARKRTRRR